MGQPMHIGQILLKGNPATINSSNPLVSQLIISNATYDGYAFSDSWKHPTIALNPAIKHMVYHAKSIIIKQSYIQNISNLPDIYVQQARISGKAELRHLYADGFVGNSANTWNLSSELPEDNALQTGTLHYDYNHNNGLFSWNGTWHHQNLKFSNDVINLETKASLKLAFQQMKQQWQGGFDVNGWPLTLGWIDANLSGKGTATGNNTEWLIESPKLSWNNARLTSHNTTIPHMHSEGLRINTTNKSVAASLIHLDHPSFTLNIDSEDFLPNLWHSRIDTIKVEHLQTLLEHQEQPIRLPQLNGTLSLSPGNVDVHLESTENDELRFTIDSVDKETLSIQAKAIPLVQLRNLLPQPVQEKSITLNGDVALNLTVKPREQWHTQGSASASGIVLSNENTSFKAGQLDIVIEDANQHGVHSATLDANQWFMHVPITPTHAWSEYSHLDEWATIPWRFKRVHMRNGTIAVGQEDEHWLTASQLKIQNWQESTPAQLTLSGVFGMAPLSADMILSADPYGTMQWESFNLSATHANLFALSDWLELSELPVIQKGHLSLNMAAVRADSHSDIKASMKFDQLELLESPDESPSSPPNSTLIPQQLTERINAMEHINLDFSIQQSQNWGQDIAHSFFASLEEKLKNDTKPTQKSTHLASLHIHEQRGLSLNERTRIRKALKNIKKKQKNWHIELTPDLGTHELTDELASNILFTQKLILSFLQKEGVRQKNIYLVQAKEQHQSSNSAAAIHVSLIK